MSESTIEAQDTIHDKTFSKTDRNAFEFNGDGFEYFKIWIVNILLTILTLGIYSAWAKVRSNRYFYSNLFLDGHNFEYLASPLTILKGRIVALVLFVIYAGLGQFFPLIAAGFAVVLLLFSPWIIVRSMMFNHRMSAYRNVQFRFHGRPGEAAVALIVWPIIGILTIGIMYPYAVLQLHRFIVRNSAFGTAKFDFHATYGNYAKIFLVAIGIGILGGAVAFASTMVFGVTLGSLLGILVYSVVLVNIFVSLTNLYYNSAVLGNHEFHATLKPWPYARVQLVNFALIVVTLGLYLPAAKVRTTKYFADNTYFLTIGSLAGITAAEKEQVSALGEELGEAFDYDIGVT